MEPFARVTGRAAPFPAPNVDTDVIMPKMFLKGIDRQGLDVGIFNLLRFENGRPRPDFILNRPQWQGAKFLVVGPNFGCGSSREHAVWGLLQIGVRGLIGTSFAGIFNDNCRNNGLLTITLAPDVVAHLSAVVGDPTTNTVTVDLEAQRIFLADVGEELAFEVEPAKKDALLRGLDAVGMTLADADAIRRFEQGHRAANPWFF